MTSKTCRPERSEGHAPNAKEVSRAESSDKGGSRAERSEVHALPALVCRAVLAAALALPLSLHAQSGDDRFIGKWEGALELGANRLRMGLVVERDSAKVLRAEMISLDRGGAKIPSSLTIHGDSVYLGMAIANASYKGLLASRDSLLGTFTQGANLPLAMHRVDAFSATPVGRKKPQEPTTPYPYRTRDVTVESVAGVRLAGTLAIPEGSGPFPAVVFVTGSGPQNRDEELMGHKPFLVLSDYLA